MSTAGGDTTSRGFLRAFRWPALWLGLWVFGWVLCVALSLSHPTSLGVDVPEGDKIEHLLAYGLLAAWAAWLFPSRRGLVVAALALVALGIAMEFAQGAFTTDRMMDWRDAVADAIGVVAGARAGLRWPRALQAMDARLPG